MGELLKNDLMISKTNFEGYGICETAFALFAVPANRLHHIENISLLCGSLNSDLMDGNGFFIVPTILRSDRNKDWIADPYDVDEPEIHEINPLLNWLIVRGVKMCSLWDTNKCWESLVAMTMMETKIRRVGRFIRTKIMNEVFELLSLGTRVSLRGLLDPENLPYTKKYGQYFPNAELLSVMDLLFLQNEQNTPNVLHRFACIFFYVL